MSNWVNEVREVNAKFNKGLAIKCGIQGWPAEQMVMILAAEQLAAGMYMMCGVDSYAIPLWLETMSDMANKLLKEKGVPIELTVTVKVGRKEES